MSQNVLQILLNTTNLYDLLYIYVTFHDIFLDCQEFIVYFIVINYVKKKNLIWLFQFFFENKIFSVIECVSCWKYQTLN